MTNNGHSNHGNKQRSGRLMNIMQRASLTRSCCLTLHHSGICRSRTNEAATERIVRGGRVARALGAAARGAGRRRRRGTRIKTELCAQLMLALESATRLFTPFAAISLKHAT